jgi:uncharacterized surface anchored protein
MRAGVGQDYGFVLAAARCHRRFVVIQRFVRVLFVLIALATLPVMAQSSNGTITGRVQDTTGAIVPGAEVTILQTSTGAAIHVKSSSAGVYTVPGIQPGNYQVRVEMPGFASISVDGITVDAARTTTQNVTLKVGAVSETVQVTSDESLLTKDSAAIQATITGDHYRRPGAGYPAA